jgi:CheY-like chemotaxis protein
MKNTGGLLEIALREETLGEPASVGASSLTSGVYCRLSVRDTGHGMDQATMRRVFDPYFTTKEQGEGTGLGLASARAIIESCQGAIQVSSAAGRGSTFQVFLPICDDPDADKEEPSEEALSIPRGTERVLFIDDDPPIVSIVSVFLQRLGYGVQTCKDGVEALDVFQSTPGAFDIVITDYTMPHMTGVTLAARLRAIRPNIPLILCSGGNDMLHAGVAIEAGFSEFLHKPVNLAELARAIRRTLDAAKGRT